MIVRLALGALVSMLCAATPSQTQAAPDQSLARMQASAWSASKRARRHVRRFHRPSYAYRVPRYGRLGDPALAPNGLPYRRPYDRGGCIIDEGYGRFTACSNR